MERINEIPLASVPHRDIQNTHTHKRMDRPLSLIAMGLAQMPANQANANQLPNDSRKFKRHTEPCMGVHFCLFSLDNSFLWALRTASCSGNHIYKCFMYVKLGGKAQLALIYSLYKSLEPPLVSWLEVGDHENKSRN